MTDDDVKAVARAIWEAPINEPGSNERLCRQRLKMRPLFLEVRAILQEHE